MAFIYFWAQTKIPALAVGRGDCRGLREAAAVRHSRVGGNLPPPLVLLSPMQSIEYVEMNIDYVESKRFHRHEVR